MAAMASSLGRNRDFMLLWSGQALSEAGSQVSTVAYPLLVLALTGSAAKAGIVGFAKMLPLALLSLPAGVLVDRVDRKRLMVACDVGRALALVSIPVALATAGLGYPQIVVVALVDGALFAVSYTAERGALSRLVPREQLSAAVARNESRAFAASIAGPPLGGLLFSVGRAVPFVFDAASYLASTAATLLTPGEFQARRHGEHGDVAAELLEGLRWLWRRPFVRACALLFAAGNPLFSGLYLLAVLLAKHHGASAALVGAMFAIVGVGGLLGGLAAPWLARRMSARRALLSEEGALPLMLALLLVVRDPLAIGATVAAAEFLVPLVTSIVQGSRVALAPDRLQGRSSAASMVLAQ